MADLRKLCIDNYCSNLPEVYTKQEVDNIVSEKVDTTLRAFHANGVSIPSDEDRAVQWNDSSGTFTVPGMFIGLCQGVFGTNATGRRYLRAELARPGIGDMDIGSRMQTNAVSGSTTILTVPIATRVQPGDQFKAKVYQNSGSTLECAFYLRGMFFAD